MLKKLMNTMLRKTQPNHATLPTFNNTLAWPRNIESRMAEADTFGQVEELAAALEKAQAEGDTETLQMFEEMQASIEEKGLDEACMNLAGYNDRIHLLSQWIELAQLCGIPHVPIEIGPLVSTADIEQTHEALHYGEPESLPASISEEVLPWIQTQQDRGWMWRYEFCASQTIKEVLGCIRPDHYLDTTRVKIPFSVDNRVLHCMWDTGMEKTNLLARPWIRAAFENGFPVEFRVFRTKTGWAACNYYVQRPLSEKWADLMQQAVELAQYFEEQVKTLEQGVRLPEEYTTDWIVTREGDLLLLEAGPGFTPTGGAHPCCFSPHKDMTGRRLLANEEGAIHWCPPEIQTHVDKIKAGGHPLEIAQAAKLNPLMLIHHAAVQGHLVSQTMQHAIAENRFLEWEEAVKLTEQSHKDTDSE